MRVEIVGNEAVVLDRSGSVVHHVSGDAAAVLTLVLQGIDEVDVPKYLQPAVAELIDEGVVRASDWSRRNLLKAGGASLAGAAIITVALPSPAAAASGSATVALVKDVNNNQNRPVLTICSTGGQGNSVRGSCTFVRTETPALISVTITLTTGTSAVGRDVYIMQSIGSSCVGGTATPVGVWVAGPQTFVAPIVNSATRFVIAMLQSGGGGVDTWSSLPVVLP